MNLPQGAWIGGQVWKVQPGLWKVQPGENGSGTYRPQLPLRPLLPTEPMPMEGARRTLEGAASQVFEVQLVEMFRKGPVATRHGGIRLLHGHWCRRCTEGADAEGADAEGAESRSLWMNRTRGVCG